MELNKKNESLKKQQSTLLIKKKQNRSKKSGWNRPNKNQRNLVGPHFDSSSLMLGNKERRTEYVNIHIPENKSITDRGAEFDSLINDIPHFYKFNWTAFITHNRWIGMMSQPFSFRRGMKSSKNWKNLFVTLYEMDDDVYVSSFVESQPDMVTVQVLVFEPRCLQLIDSMIADAMTIEGKEFIQRIEKKFGEVGLFDV